MTVETIKGSNEPIIPEDNYNTSYAVCPDCGEETFVDSRNSTGEPDNWEDFVVCPRCQWRYEELENEIEELEFC